MPREFNPDLFEATAKPPMDHLQHDTHRKKIRELESQVHSLTQRVDKLTLALEQKTVQLSHALKSLEGHSKSALQEIVRNQSSMNQKLTERKVADAKLQELMDRHNQIVHGFEMRMTHMQKLSAEQEMKILSYQATIDEVLREIRTLRSARL
jgi:chromosome segregation ATPase